MRPFPLKIIAMRNVLRSPPRTGFTLVEMMVVIGIITLLAAVLITAIGRMGVKAKEEATYATIRKVSNQVQERLEALDRLKSQPQWTKDAQAKVTNYARQNPSLVVTLDQAKALLLKDRMKISFPQSFNEYAYVDPAELIKMLDPQYTLGMTIPNLPQQLDYSAWSTAHPTHQTETESSAILYYVLTNGKTLGIPTVNPDDYKASEVADTDGDGLTEFIDAWGKPLRFYRWPTRLFCPTGSFDGAGRPVIDRTTNASWMTLFKGLPAAATPDPLAKDQDDPTLVLIDKNGNMNSTISQLFTEANYHTPRTYHDFLLVSSGPDGQKIASSDDAFGLLPPTDQYSAPGTLNTATSYGYLAQPKSGQYNALTDNITNRNR